MKLAAGAMAADPAGAAPLLELSSVSKRFGDRVAVDAVSLQLQPGEIFGLLGPKGAGKTTLLRMAVDLLRPDGGSVRLLGAPPGPAQLEQVGYLPEERGLPSRPRVLELLTYLGELKGARRRDARTQARALIQRVQLDARESSRVGELSKGNQQKIQIAAALMGAPRVLLVDEPFSGLDPVNRQLAVELFQEAVRGGAAVLLSTHQLHHVHTLCDRLLLVHRGRALLDGLVPEVRARFADGGLLVRGAPGLATLAPVLRAEPRDAGAGAGGGASSFKLLLHPGLGTADLLRAALEQQVALEALEPDLPSVEEIFVRLVTAQEEAVPVARVLHG